MKKLAFIFGFIFCTALAANAQLSYRNGKLRLNVPDNYPSNFTVHGLETDVIWKANAFTFVGIYPGAEFYLYPATAFCQIGPMEQGDVVFCPKNGDLFHNIWINNLYNMSDARAKTNVRPVNSAISTILNLRPVTYQFISRPNNKSTIKSVAGADGTETGFLAQELAEVLPNAVRITEDDKMLVNYISIIPILVKAVQEQNAQIEALKAEVAALKNR